MCISYIKYICCTVNSVGLWRYRAGYGGLVCTVCVDIMILWCYCCVLWQCDFEINLKLKPDLSFLTKLSYFSRLNEHSVTTSW